MEDPLTPPAVKLAAARDLLDRNDLVGRTVVAVEAPWLQALSRIFTADDDIVDVEIVYGETDADDAPFTDEELDDSPRQIEPRRPARREAQDDDKVVRPLEPITTARVMDEQGRVSVRVDMAEFSDLPPAYDKAGRKLAGEGENVRWTR